MDAEEVLYKEIIYAQVAIAWLERLKKCVDSEILDFELQRDSFLELHKDFRLHESCSCKDDTTLSQCLNAYTVFLFREANLEHLLVENHVEAAIT